MAKHTVNLDALIARSDFATTDAQVAAQANENFEKIALKDLVGEGALLPRLLRKPDFQRETTQWTPAQIVTLVESFINGELIPAVILWKSTSHIFVIDGAHRLSALMSWAQDDYGDGPKSYQYFKGELSAAQKRLASATRIEVGRRLGTFQHFSAQFASQDEPSTELASRLMNFATRGLQVQWIQGDADKAESSFFKINTQGSVLDPVEERLLRNRKKAPAIAARSVVRAATGHAYWSKFSQDTQSEISTRAKSIHRALFAPEVNTPVRTIDLPVGGTTSVTDALEMLMNLADIVDDENRLVEKYSDDDSGQNTLSVLKKLEAVTLRLVGNQAQSLGLHPFVYFYTSKGRHYVPLMVAMFSIVADKIRNNDKAWFRRFTDNRGSLERLLIEHKTIITLLISALASGQRWSGAKSVLTFMIDGLSSGNEITPDAIASALKLESRLYSIQSRPGTNFSDDAKSSAFLREAFKTALKCPICHGYLDPTKSASYDHVVRVRDGGDGNADNCQLTHPYCNTGYKN